MSCANSCSLAFLFFLILAEYFIEAPRISISKVSRKSSGFIEISKVWRDSGLCSLKKFSIASVLEFQKKFESPFTTAYWVVTLLITSFIVLRYSGSLSKLLLNFQNPFPLRNLAKSISNSIGL